MIKVFCDLCGTEYDRSAKMIGAEGAQHSVALRGATNREIVFVVKVHIAIRDTHVDICGACRWSVLNSLDTRPKSYGSVDVKV